MVSSESMKKFNLLILIVDLILLLYWGYLISLNTFSIEISVLLGIVSILIAIESGIIARKSKARMDTIGEAEIQQCIIDIESIRREYFYGIQEFLNTPIASSKNGFELALLSISSHKFPSEIAFLILFNSAKQT